MLINDSLIQIEGNELLQLALEVAKEGHKNVPRNENTDWPYVVHPVNVFNIVKEFTEDKDSIFALVTQSAALLHDVIEDSEHLNSKEKLAARLKAEFETILSCEDAQKLGDAIASVVQELSNATTMSEGKRTWQVEHARSMSDAAKVVKAADQSANMIDSANTPSGWAINREVIYFNKALDVAKACGGVSEKLDAFVKNIYGKAREIISSGSGVKIDIKLAIEQSQNYEKENTKRYATTKHISPTSNTEGIRYIETASNGDVTAFGVVVDPEEDLKQSCNKMADNLRNLSETQERLRVTTGKLEQIDGQVNIRRMEIKPSISLGRFVTMAGAIGAIGNEFSTQLSAARSR